MNQRDFWPVDIDSRNEWSLKMSLLSTPFWNFKQEILHSSATWLFEEELNLVIIGCFLYFVEEKCQESIFAS